MDELWVSSCTNTKSDAGKLFMPRMAFTLNQRNLHHEQHKSIALHFYVQKHDQRERSGAFGLAIRDLIPSYKSFPNIKPDACTKTRQARASRSKSPGTRAWHARTAYVEEEKSGAVQGLFPSKPNLSARCQHTDSHQFKSSIALLYCSRLIVLFLSTNQPLSFAHTLSFIAINHTRLQLW